MIFGRGKAIDSNSATRVLFSAVFLSGCAALVYEVVWFQVLQLLVGSSAVSLGVLLGTYMGGMCLGSIGIPRLISAKQNALRVCAYLELGIGAIGLLILFLLPEVSVIYSAHASEGSGLVWRSVFAAGCLLPPTVLMGATLPILARWIRGTAGVSKLGSFYGCNVGGAVFGCLLAGFYLLRVHDTAVATYAAAALNACAAIVTFVLSFIAKPEAADANDESQTKAVEIEPRGESALPIYITIALSGMTALGAEVIWTRLLSLMLGSTVYTFSIILAVFLIGIGIGSHFGTGLGRRSKDARQTLGWCQLLLAAAISWTAYMLAESLPYWPSPTASNTPWINLQMSLSYCLWALLPPTLLWGASFPLALAAAARHSKDPARLLGNISAANTFGGIIGGVGFSVLLLPCQGMQYAQRILIVLVAFSAILLLLPRTFRLERKVPLATVFRNTITVGFPAVAIPVLCAISIPQAPGELLAFGHQLQSFGGKTELLFASEGNNYPVCVSRLWHTNIRIFHVSGKVEASTYVQDMRLQRVLGHLPALLHSKPESVLVVGCGAGVTAGTFTLHPDVKKITICELEPVVPQIAARYFANENYHVLADPRTRVISDDARHFILTTDQKYDIITSDPIHPWVKGSANLYTKEYFELVKAHLNRGGIVTQWVPLYQSDPAVVKSELATFFEVFPNGTIWSTDRPGHGSDIVLLGQYGGTQINLDEMQHRFEQAGYARVTQSLEEIGYNSALHLFAGYSGRASDLGPWLAGAEINHDQNLRLQYMAGFTVNQQDNEKIYQDMLTYRKFPEKLFTGSPETRQHLAQILARFGGTPKRLGG